jgi:hypothetical protein
VGTTTQSLLYMSACIGMTIKMLGGICLRGVTEVSVFEVSRAGQQESAASPINLKPPLHAVHQNRVTLLRFRVLYVLHVYHIAHDTIL